MGRDFLADARAYFDRAVGGMETLNIGPLDYNVTTTADYLRAAAACLEEHLREQERHAAQVARASSLDAKPPKSSGEPQ